MLPEWSAGRNFGPINVIDPAKKDDIGLLAHEDEHGEQWFLTGAMAAAVVFILVYNFYSTSVAFAVLPGVFFGAHFILHKFVPAYRLWAEVEAYKVQALHYPDDRRERFAEFLADPERYNLNITKGEALALLSR
jgi:hypothetical protein